MRGDYESGEASSSTWPEQNDDEVKKMEKPQQRDAEQLMRDADRLMMLNEIGRTVSTQQDLPSVLESIYQQARQRLQIDSFYVSLYLWVRPFVN